MLSAVCFKLDQSKILSSGDGLIDYCYRVLVIDKTTDFLILIGKLLVVGGIGMYTIVISIILSTVLTL